MKLNVLFICLLTCYLTACGGGDSGNTTSSQPVKNNIAPVANVMNLPTEIIIGQPIHFDASASSDPNNDSLSYKWSIIDGNGETQPLVDSTAKELNFEPKIKGKYQLKLVVNDGTVNSQPFIFDFEVTSLIVADAGEDQNVKVGDKVTLSGSHSLSQEGIIIDYTWQLIEKPNQSETQINEGDSVDATLTIDTVGTYIAELKVRDQFDNSNSARVSLHATAFTQNSVPKAKINADKLSLNVGQTVSLDARESHDADGDLLTYQWTLNKPTDSQAVLTTTSQVETSFSADIVGDYTVRLIVLDQSSVSEEVSLMLTASNENQQPIAVAGLEQTA